MDFKQEAVNKILSLIKGKQKPVLGLATGSTPLPVYKELIKKHKQGVDFSHLRIFHLDEYVGLSKDNGHSYQYYLHKNFLDHVNIKEENCYFLNGTADDLKKETRRYEKLIKKEGGIDLQILGIGRDGHIGFNEPVVIVDEDFLLDPDRERIKNYNKFLLKIDKASYREVIKKIYKIRKEEREEVFKELPAKKGKKKLAKKIRNQKITFFVEGTSDDLKINEKVQLKNTQKAFKTSTHLEDLAVPTIEDNSRFFDDLAQVKLKTITLGTKTILDSKKILLLARGERKASIIKKTLKKPESAQLPASLVKNHPGFNLVLDEAASSLLSVEREKELSWNIKASLVKFYLSLSKKKRFITLDLGGTHCRTTLRGEGGKSLLSLKLKTLASEGKEVVLNQIVRSIKFFLKIAGNQKTKILIATAGKVNSKLGVIKEAKNLDFQDFPIRKKIKERLRFPVKRIEVVNDLIAGWYGEKSEILNNNFAVFYFSTGVGAAFKGENIEPGWSVSLKINKKDNIKNVRYLGTKENGDFYKKEDLEENEYFLEEVTGGKALIDFAYRKASSFETKLAERISKNDIKNPASEIASYAKEGDSFGKYCLKKTGEYAGVGIACVFNHFLDKDLFDKKTTFLINGPLGLDPFYFGGIKKGVEKAKRFLENIPSLENIKKSSFEDSTQGIQKGVLFYHQSLVKKRKKNLPSFVENVVVSDKKLPSRINSWPSLEGVNITLLEPQKNESKVFAGNFIKKIKAKNEIEKVDDKKEIKNKSNLTIAPERMKEKIGEPALFYESLPSDKQQLKFDSYFGFDSLLLEPFLASIRAHAGEIKRTRYDISSKLFSKYYGQLLQYLSVKDYPFAHRFQSKGVNKESKELICLREFFKKRKGETVFVSPHSDDAEISAGALIKWMIDNGKDVENWVVTETHNEMKRRNREAQKAKEILSNQNNPLSLNFMGFDKEDLERKSVKREIKGKIEKIDKLNALFLPSRKDSHPTHQKTRKLIEDLFSSHFDNPTTFYYFSPWAGNYDTYFVSEKNYFQNKKEEKIASNLKKGIGKSGILSELCGEFKNKGYFVKYVERFKRKVE